MLMRVNSLFHDHDLEEVEEEIVSFLNMVFLYDFCHLSNSCLYPYPYRLIDLSAMSASFYEVVAVVEIVYVSMGLK